MRAVGSRSLTSATLLAGGGVALWRMGLLRTDYWAQLDPWVTFLAAGFAMLAGTLVFRFWRLADPSEYYLRFGELLPWGAETALVGPHHRCLIAGHAVQPKVLDFPPLAQHAIYVAIFLSIGLVTLDNRAVALLLDVPARFERSKLDYCVEAEKPKPPDTNLQGCKLVLRAYKLGYTKDLGTCAPKQDELVPRELCKRRQLDEPYMHYAWRLFESRGAALVEDDGKPGMIEKLGADLDHLDAMLYATIDSIAMHPRASHHLFTNLPDPRPTFGDRVRARLTRGGCNAKLAHVPHFPPITDPSQLLEHVVSQLLFNPAYKPVVAQCEEIVIHWDAPADACAQLAKSPEAFLAGQGALEPARDVLAWRRRKAEIARLGVKQPRELAAAQRIVSFQCLMIDKSAEWRTRSSAEGGAKVVDKSAEWRTRSSAEGGAKVDDAVPTPPVERSVTLDGERFAVREARMPPGSDQIRMYKELAALLAEGFSYGHLTSNQAIDAAPAEATIAASFKDPAYLLTKLDLLRDADLFLGNDWLAKRPDLLAVYPYYLHLQNFIEIFRRQYKLHRGRL